MQLEALTDGTVTSTGTLTVDSRIIGGVLITADGTNNATISIKRDDTNGKEVFNIVTKQPAFIVGPVSLEDTTAAYYSVSGTGAAAQFYEWQP